MRPLVRSCSSPRGRLGLAAGALALVCGCDRPEPPTRFVPAAADRPVSEQPAAPGSVRVGPGRNIEMH